MNHFLPLDYQEALKKLSVHEKALLFTMLIDIDCRYGKVNISYEMLPFATRMKKSDIDKAIKSLAKKNMLHWFAEDNCYYVAEYINCITDECRDLPEEYDSPESLFYGNGGEE